LLNSSWKGFEGGRGDSRALGVAGELIAARYLWVNGHKIFYRNFRAPKGGEVDIVSRHRDTLVFTEVKTRRSLDYGRPADAVNRDKQFLITRGAMAWLRMLDFPDIQFRFDIVEVILEKGQAPQVSQIENAFNLPEPYVYG